MSYLSDRITACSNNKLAHSKLAVGSSGNIAVELYITLTSDRLPTYLSL